MMLHLEVVVVPEYDTAVLVLGHHCYHLLQDECYVQGLHSHH